MGYYESKEDKALAKMTATLTQLDQELDRIDQLSAGEKKHPLEKRHAERLALHDIKRILHDMHRYDHYCEEEQEEIEGQAMDLRSPYYQPSLEGGL
ncbi:hypothetical protein [Levilactobacillus brevis]|uniref:hypothetical protein n=1 Tax=Levilactobacillus brevis TaxID=1580 RepID=UPI0004042F83|nr:hypothetical protein [Levilactobacillus brevis]